MLERKNKSGVSRINSYRDKTVDRSIRCRNRYNAYDKEDEAKKNSQKVYARIKYDDKRYESLTIVFMSTLKNKIKKIKEKGIQVTLEDFEKILEELLQATCQSKIVEVRFPNDDKQRIKNAILMAVNNEKELIIEKLEKGRDDE